MRVSEDGRNLAVISKVIEKRALEFDGENDKVNCGDNSSLEGMSELTMCAWVNAAPPNKTITQPILVKGWSGSGNSYNMQYDHPVAGLHINVKTVNGEKYLAFQNPPTTKGWHYIVGIYDGDFLYTYLNGSPDNSVDHPYDGNVTINTGNLLIGYLTDANKYFDGIIGEIQIYSRALDSAEIIWLYNHPGKIYNTNGLKLWLPFTEGYGDTLYDKSGNNNNGDIIGAEWVVGMNRSTAKVKNKVKVNNPRNKVEVYDG